MERGDGIGRRALLAAGSAGAAAVTGLAGPALGQTAERPSRIRHYVLATHDKRLVCDQIYDALGLPPTPKKDGPGVTEKFGFTSEMMRVGTTMIEVVQPLKEDHELTRWLKERDGDGGFMVVMQTFDADKLRARAGAEQLKLTRDMPFMGQQMIQFDYRRFGTHFELYKYTPEDNWWGNPLTGPYSDARTAVDIVGGDVAVENPSEIAAQTARLFLGRQDGDVVHFEDRTIRFVPSKGAWRGLVALDLKARDKGQAGKSAAIGGVTFRYV